MDKSTAGSELPQVPARTGSLSELQGTGTYTHWLNSIFFFVTEA